MKVLQALHSDLRECNKYELGAILRALTDAQQEVLADMHRGHPRFSQEQLKRQIHGLRIGFHRVTSELLRR